MIQAQKARSRNTQMRAQLKIQSKNKYDIYINAKITKAMYNQIKATHRDTLALYKMSGCELPAELQFPII